MKPFLFIFFLILSHFIIFSQPKIDKITWVGENNEYLSLSKKNSFLQKEALYQPLEVVKYVRNNYIILSETSHAIKFEQKYNIVRLTQDTLILAPVGYDLHSLSEPNEQNQYVFVNSMLKFKFVSLYYETPIDNHDGDLISVAFYIDSTKNSKIVLKDEIYNKTKTYKSLMDKRDYERLIKILSSCDISNYYFESNKVIDDRKCRRQVLAIQFNEQIKTFKGCAGTAFIPRKYVKLPSFLAEYISLKANIDIKSERKKDKSPRK